MSTPPTASRSAQASAGPPSAAAADPSVVHLYTDGACSGNPGPGGWAFILRHPASGKGIERSGGNPSTTNNQMELTAVIEGLQALTRPCTVDLYSDSQYVLKGLDEWLAGWKRNGWRRGKERAPVKNVELWQALDHLKSVHTLRFHWIRGHAGHPENERCDQMAVAEIEQFRRRRG